MKSKIIFIVSLLGVVIGITAAHLFSRQGKAQPPVYAPISSPFDTAIYANGIIESDQDSGSNITIYPEVAGPITRIAVREGDAVRAGELLFEIDHSIPKANLDLAQANFKTAQDQYEKRLVLYKLDPDSISKDALDTAKDSMDQTSAAMNSAAVLLKKYSITAPADGVVLAINTARGSYVSSQGAYDTYTQGYQPVLVMSATRGKLAVRCYIDEILVSRLPPPEHIRAQMSLRGTDIKVPLEFVRVQPYVTPKIQLTDQRQERVDQRVLPVIFRFDRKNIPTIYPGQIVDVFIGQQ